MTRETLTIGDRTTSLHLSPQRGTPPAGVVVLHAWWGLNDDVVAYADRLADAGFAVAAPDLFEGRLATTIEEAERLSESLEEDVADAFVLASVDALVAAIGDPTARVAAIGFSMGAPWALWLPARRPEVVASVVYYGTMQGPTLSQARTPVLGHFAENDEYEPEEGVTALDSTLRTAGREVGLHRYPGTGHWFAEPSRDAYVPAAAGLAFDRTVAFLRRELLEKG
ncbi:dienelactone hydrolase family protein [Cellulomonas sp. KRMCY2]|uniref:dienelactone hydrolase family protein n=1 Tax=Cellulomonas sp. KRMCY2 TaxID=1304865 RepID=UPI00045E869C|nr:dienelactone hydrolase family protein [Cellulomonas sp. KRMCY2]